MENMPTLTEYLKSQFMIFFKIALTDEQAQKEIRFLASAKISDESNDNFFINKGKLEEAIQVLAERVEEGLLKYVGERKTVSFKVSAAWGEKNVSVKNEYWQKTLHALKWHEVVFGKTEIWWQKN